MSNNYPNLNLSGKKLKDTYQNVVQINNTTNTFVDGLGNEFFPTISASNVIGIVLFSTTSSHSLTSSYALNGGSVSIVIETGSLYQISSSWSINAISASYAPFSQTYQVNTISSSFASSSISSSYSLLARSASYYPPQIYQVNTISASYASRSISSSYSEYIYYNVTQSFFLISSSSWSSSSIDASYALTASYSTVALTASYSTVALTASYVSGSSINFQSASYALTASYSNRSITASYFNENSASLISGSLYLRSNKGSLWKLTIFEDDDNIGTLQLEGPF